MQAEELKNLVHDIQSFKAEKQNVELKSASDGFPRRIHDTLSAFSNQDGGGVMVFGVNDKPSFEVVGVYDAEDVQRKIMECCQQMEPPVRAIITMCEINGKHVVGAEIPGVEASKRPVFYGGTGIAKGSFIRVGDGDRQMTQYEIYSYEAFKRQVRDELRTVESASMKMFDARRLGRYIEAVKDDRHNLRDNVADEDILEFMGVTLDGKPTLAGIMTFSLYPQAYFPQLSITAVSVPGTQMGDTGPYGERFIDNKRITGSIPEMLDDAVDFVRRNCRTMTIIDENGRRQDRSEYPIAAIREAILNALVHRDYSVYTQNTPISIEMYRDRLEIRSSGELYGHAPIEELGKSRLETRNPILANMLELLSITENRYSGVPTMLSEARKAGLPAPEFSQRRGEFKVVFRNNHYNAAMDAFEVDERSIPYGKEDTEPLHSRRLTLEQQIVEFCRTPRTRQELVDFTGMSRYHIMSKYIQPMMESGAIKCTMPEKPKSKNQRFIATR